MCDGTGFVRWGEEGGGCGKNGIWVWDRNENREMQDGGKNRKSPLLELLGGAGGIDVGKGECGRAGKENRVKTWAINDFLYVTIKLGHNDSTLGLFWLDS